MQRKIQVEPGMRFADWEVIEEVESKKTSKGAILRQLLCRCTCCNETERKIVLNTLRAGLSNRCVKCANRLKSAKYRETKHHLTMTVVGFQKCLPDFSDQQFATVLQACLSEAQTRGVD